VDWQKDLLYVERQKTKDLRVVPMNGRVKRILRDAGITLFNDLKKKTATLRFSHYAKRAGLSFHLHALRHTFATNLAAQGEDIRIISELLGHKDIRVSLIYSKVDITRLKGAVDKLGYNLVTKFPDAEKSAQRNTN
jgi:integrase